MNGSLHFKSIRARLTFWLFSAIGLILVAVISVAVTAQVAKVKAQLDDDMDFYLAIGESALESPLWDLNESNIEDVLDMLIREPVILKAAVIDRDGNILIQKEQPDTGRYRSVFLNRIVREKAIDYNEQFIGYLRLTLSGHIYQLQLIQSLMGWALLSVTLLFTIWAVINGVSHRITKPIIDLCKVADRIEKGDYHATFVQTSEDEVGQLSVSLQSMQSQIQQHISMLEQDRVEINALYHQTSAMNQELNEMLRVVNENFEQTLKTLADAIEANDCYTKGHCERVRKLAVELAARIGMENPQLQQLSHAAILHDIGKIGVPYHILNKETPLTPEEVQVIRRHSEIGSQIVGNIHFLEASVPIIHQHHERYDGTGYPQGIAGEEILLPARILSIADAYDAMTSSRAYRKEPLAPEAALRELQLGSGLQFDPDLVRHFCQYLQQEEGAL